MTSPLDRRLSRRRFLAASLTATGMGTAGGCLGATTGGANGDAELSVGGRPPGFTLTTTAGDDVSLYPVERPTITFFMAAWCSYCKRESETLTQIHDEFGDSIRILSVGVNPDRDTMDDLRQFRSEYSSGWAHAMGTPELIRDYRITALDTTYIVSTDGRTAYTDTGITGREAYRREVSKMRGRE